MFEEGGRIKQITTGYTPSERFVSLVVAFGAKCLDGGLCEILRA